MLVSDVQTRVKDLFGDVGTAQITDAMILSWINSARRDIAIKTECLTGLTVYSSQAGVAQYALESPSGIYAPLSVRFVKYNGKLLARMNPREIINYSAEASYDNNSPVTGTPILYNLHEQSIWLYPAPSVTGVNNIEAYYSKYPTAAGNITLPTTDLYLTLPELFHDDVVLYCLAQAKRQDEDWVVARDLLQEYDSNIAMKGAKYTGRDDKYHVIQGDPEDYIV